MFGQSRLAEIILYYTEPKCILIVKNADITDRSKSPLFMQQHLYKCNTVCLGAVARSSVVVCTGTLSQNSFNISKKTDGVKHA